MGTLPISEPVRGGVIDIEICGHLSIQVSRPVTKVAEGVMSEEALSATDVA